MLPFAFDRLFPVHPAMGVKLPRKKKRKPTTLLAIADIIRMLEELPEPTKSVVELILFGSCRPGECLALRWRNIHRDRIDIEQRLYDDEFDDVKTDAGEREVPFDLRGRMRAALVRTWKSSKFHNPDDLVVCTRKGNLVERRNLLRHIKAAALKLGLPKTIDFRSFRTVHASLMSKGGARPETIRDNMGHSNVAVQDVYVKT